MNSGVLGRIGIRLALWYSALFIVSSLIILLFSSLLFHKFLVKQERAVIQNRAEDFAAHFDNGGFDAMLADIHSEVVPGVDPFFIRVADAANRTIFSNGAEFPRFDLTPLERSAGNRQWTRREAMKSEETIEVYSLVLPDKHVLQVGQPSRLRTLPLRRFVFLSIGIAVPVILLGLIGGAVLSVKTFRPIRGLISTVRGISETGQLSARVRTSGAKDELSELGSLFNLMLDRIERLVAGMRDALDNVAHDFRTPMTRLRNTAEEALQDERPGPKHLEALADCLEQSGEAMTMLKTLMDISEAETGTLVLQREALGVSDLVNGAVDLYRHVAEDKNITLTSAVDPALRAFCDGHRLRQALANLIDNAIKYTPAGGRVAVDAGARDGAVWLRVRDSGIGIPAHEASRVWDRLFRGENGRRERGLGLGLSLVRAIVFAHGGTASIEPNDGPGVSILLTLPAAPGNLSQT